MEYLIGALVALGVAAFAALAGFDRDRSFYPTVLIVVAAYYVLFAVMGASTKILELEIAAAACFAVLALLGFKKSMWIAAAGIAGHGAFDFLHHLLIDDPGVPVWWPAFCGTVDIVLGCWLAFRLSKSAPHAKI